MEYELRCFECGKERKVYSPEMPFFSCIPHADSCSFHRERLNPETDFKFNKIGCDSLNSMET